jgi:hypothetical protein
MPYPLETSADSLMAVLFTLEVNDMSLYICYGNEPEAFTRVLRQIIENVNSMSRTPFCLDITVHAHIFGRPFGAIEFAKSLDLAKRHTTTWLTNHAELANRFAEAV